MALLDKLKDVLIIAFGAFLGVNTRFIIYKKLEKINFSKNYIIVLINTVSSFFLGLCFSISSQNNSSIYSYHLILMVSIGLLGSLSTFSAFIYDLYELLIQSKLYRAFKLFVISITLGILFFIFGFLLGT